MSQIFGPVPSRRLGFSLGVDTIPFKTCSLDCIYCQLSKTTDKTVMRKEYINADEILRELEKVLLEEKRIDYITLSGSGEPTLNSEIGKIIKKIKTLTSTSVAVLTNGTLLYLPQIQEELSQADLIIPSLDAVSQDTFQKVNRPHSSLHIDNIISGIISFSREFKGKIWLEIVLVKGINDSLKEIRKTARIIKNINLDRVQLNTVVRPPAEEFAQALDLKELEKIKAILGEKCEIIAEFDREQQKAYKRDIGDAILTMIKRRPVTADDIANSLGLHQNEAIKYIDVLKEKNKVKNKFHNGKRYYY